MEHGLSEVKRNRDYQSQTNGPGQADIRYEYDGLGRMTGVTDPGGLKTFYRYDKDGICCGVNSPDTGLAVYDNQPPGRKVTRRTANGVISTSSYDDKRRLVKVSFSDPGQDVGFSYDPGSGPDAPPTSMRDASGVYSFAHDEKGRLAGQTALILGGEYVTRYTRDGAGRITALLYPGGGLAEYRRDAQGRVSAVSHNGRCVVRNILRTAEGRIKSMEHGNGLITSRKYGPDGRMVSQELSDIGKIELEYSQNGQLIRVTDRLDSQAGQTFAYDGLGRLIKAQGPYGSRAYSYDANGNRLSRTADGQSQVYGYTPGTNRLCELEGAFPRRLEYDESGNVIRDGLTVMAYNPARRLAGTRVGDAPPTHYTYNGLGQRVIKSHKGGSTVYHYDVEGRLIAESNQKGEVQKEYLWLDGELIAAAEGGGLYFVHANHRNEPALVTNGNGTEVWKNVTEPFGISAESYPKVAETYRNFTLNLRLPGQYFESETGYHYNGFRDYSPELGRYLQADPIGLNGGMNLYAYCGGDPVNRKDERGLGFEDDDYQDSYGGWDDSGLDGMGDLDENDGASSSGGDNGVEVTVEVDEKASKRLDGWDQKGHQRWYPFVGQVGGVIKDDLAIQVQAAFGKLLKYASSGVRSSSEEWVRFEL